MQEQLFEADLLRIERRDLDADGGLSWNGRDDADRFGLQVQRDVVFERFDLLHLDADGRVHFERGDRGPAVDLADFGFDTEAQQGLFEDLGLALQFLFQRGLIYFFRLVQQRSRGELIGGKISICSSFGRRAPLGVCSLRVLPF